MSAYDKTSIQINRCKRILVLVDDYAEKMTSDTRTTLRKALMDEFETPAIATPVAAGSVVTEEFAELVQNVRHGLHAQTWPPLVNYINAWGAQQREAGRGEGYVDGKGMADEIVQAIDRATRARAEKAEARVKEIEAGRQALQAPGKHPAPCARHCEANAFQIEVRRLEAESAHKQAIIDRLMLEYCPDEMTPEQMANWEKHQVRGESRHQNVIYPSDTPR